MKINQEHLRLLFSYMHHFSGVKGADRSSLQKRLLEDAKSARKDCSWNEFEEKGINFYPKTGVTIEGLCQFAIKNKWVKEVGSSLFLTNEGKQKYYDILTDGYSPAYLQYVEKVFRSFDEKNMVRPKSTHMMEWFSKGYPAERLMEWASEPNEIGTESKMYHLDVLEALGYSEEKLEGHLVFQFVPQLFLPYGEDGDIELEINGFEKPLNFMLSKPYRNKRYVVGGLAIGREATHTGFYPLILPKDLFPDSVDMELIWRIGGEEGYTVTHKLHIAFKKERMTGNLYTSTQQLVRSSEVPTIQLTTFLPEDKLYLNKRDAEFQGTMTWNHTLIEKVKLDPIPMELSYISNRTKSTFR